MVLSSSTPFDNLYQNSIPPLYGHSHVKVYKKKMRKSFILATVLRHFTPERKIVIETNAFNLIVIGVLL
jgi:RNA:NAD 2'-phosphotransferase (TPT1/KptA family)